MEKRNVIGLKFLFIAVVQKHSSLVISIHQHPDAAEKFRQTLSFPDDFEVIELLDELTFKQS